MIKNIHKIAAFCLIVTTFVLYMGCKSDNSISPESITDTHSKNNVSVSFYSGINTLKTNDNNSINITQAKFVLRQMRLKVSGEETLANIRMDPFVVNIDVDGRVIVAAIAQILSGNYHNLKLQIHKPTPQDNITDPDFFDGNRSFSTVVKGYFNGNPFVFKSGMTSARGIDIENSPIFITPTVLVNFTIQVNPYTWFERNGEIMNPTSSQNQNDIDNNIRDSFRRVFRDMDMNGHPD